MREVTLGKSGLRVPAVGFGGIPIQRLTPEESDRVLEEAIERGVRFFDNARIYTDSESKMGRVLPRYRDKIVLATKSFQREGAKVREDLETSLRELRTDRIDLYQCHNIASEAELERALSPGGALETMVKAKEEGKILHIGITGHKPWIVTKALKSFPFETAQFPFNYLETKALEELIPLCKSMNVGTIAMKPVAGGALREVALNLRFIFSSGLDLVIPGMDGIRQVAENLAVLDLPMELTDEEVQRLEAEKKRLGDGFCRRCEYCMPCPKGLNIPFLHLLKAYYFLYDLKDWAWGRLEALPKKYTDCEGCGVCVKRCPYNLDTPKIFRETWKKMAADRGVHE